MDDFRNRILTALADPNLQTALDANAERRIQARESAFDSLPEDLQSLRQQAHKLRSEVMINLEKYLEAFTSQAESNGMIVHHADDAKSACQIVIDIAQRSSQMKTKTGSDSGHSEPHFRDERTRPVIAKSKSMVSEEIELNKALQSVGLEPIETDLGEYIVQLRGEHPSHIITPAVHLSREQVGQTFQEKLGIPLTRDIPTLTEAARAALRETFLDADIGISGVNFGVVETGALCIVTNEGNGRMVTTIPPVHIALMGIERLVPTTHDLCLMLALLPRSATGQKITVYTQIIHGPRLPEDVDGPLERHLILVDNGRKEIYQSPLQESLLCIRCGACLNACPIFREIGGHAYVSSSGEHTPYPGPIGSVVSPGLYGQAQFGHLAQASTLCGACKDACPVDIDLPKLLLRVRADSKREDSDGKGSLEWSNPPGLSSFVTWGLSLYAWLAQDARRFHLSEKILGMISHIYSPLSSWMRLPVFTGWGYARDFPRPALHPFRERFSALSHIPKSEQIQPQDFPPPSKPVSKAVSSHETDEPLTERFQRELAALNGNFHPCTLQTLPERILSLLNDHRISRIMSWGDDQLPEGLLASLQAAGVRIDHTPHPDIQVGLTGSIAAIAETGTLVIPSGPERPQAISLLPEVHIAILRAEDIYAELAKVLSLRKVKDASVVTLISGPSRTADIEMTLTIGVHGPREVHVFCLKN